MANIPDEQLTAALSSVVRSVLAAGGKISIAGLGAFSVRYERSQVVTVPGARVHVKPPRNVITFVPDVKSDDK